MSPVKLSYHMSVASERADGQTDFLHWAVRADAFTIAMHSQRKPCCDDDDTDQRFASWLFLLLLHT